MQSEVEQFKRTQIRGRFNYDEIDQRISILEQYEFRNPQSDYSFGRYYFHKPVRLLNARMLSTVNGKHVI